MADSQKSYGKLAIGFISTRFAGTDGVSLETSKWAEVLERRGHTCYYFAGQCDRPPERSVVVPEAFFGHPEVRAAHGRFFSGTTRTAEDAVWVHDWRATFKRHLLEFIRRFELRLLITENILAIPLQIPLALAVAEVVAETGIQAIGHHHDLAWERKRFLVNAVEDFLAAAFPPQLPTMQHAVINVQAQQQLALRRGVPSMIVPNVMNYEEPPPPVDAYAAGLRQALGLDPDELFVLQPTRVIQRKGIEHAIELLQRLNRRARLVISHASGDEGLDYQARVRNYAELLGVPTLFCDEQFDEVRREAADGRKIYSLWDAYPPADLVTYPSLIEGFGNAFLEAVYFRKLLVVNNYSIYATDIGPKGFEVILFDEYITEDTVARTRHLLDHPAEVAGMVERNYQLALRHFSYTVLDRRLEVLLDNAFLG